MRSFFRWLASPFHKPKDEAPEGLFEGSPLQEECASILDADLTNVVPFKRREAEPEQRPPSTPDQVLESATGVMAAVVVVGMFENGSLFVNYSGNDLGQAIILMETAKLYMLSPDA